MWRDTYREKVGGETRTRWSGNHGLEKKRNSEGSLRFHGKEIRNRSERLEKTCNRNRGKKENTYCRKAKPRLARQGRTKAHESWKKDEQHQLHSLAGCGEKNSSRRLGFATLESKETNKREREKPAGTLQGRRCRQRVQRGTHAGCGGFQRAGKTGEAPGAWQQREKGLRTATGLKEKGMGWADGFRRAGWREQD